MLPHFQLWNHTDLILPKGIIVYSRVPTTVIHRSSFHRICPKPQSCPRLLPVDRRWNYWLESQTSVLRPTPKLLTLVPVDSSPKRLSFDRCWNYWLESQSSALRTAQKLLTHIQAVCPSTVTTTNDSRPRRLSSDCYRNQNFAICQHHPKLEYQLCPQ